MSEMKQSADTQAGDADSNRGSRLCTTLRLYLVCTPNGMPILWALADLKLDEREVLRAMLDADQDLLAGRPGLLRGHTFEGVTVRVAQRVLAMAAAIWRNHKTGAPITRSLVTLDHRAHWTYLPRMLSTGPGPPSPT
ncbi:hypothetical protein ABZY21_02940 [Streptomyces cinerochromogenes]